jgi:murein DD-endopeptidase MepM/ murein hydrolase activator NlpD
MRTILLGALATVMLTGSVGIGSMPTGPVLTGSVGIGSAPTRAAAPVTPLAMSDQAPAPRGTFGWPLAGFPGVVRPFEPPAHPYGPGHRGVDLRGSPGLPVLAAGDGVVAFAGMVAGRPVVSVDHANGLRTTYEPVEVAVTTGMVVRRGDVLGTLLAGHPGCPVAACLHWGVRRGEEYLDPLRLLAPGRVRLLPVQP